ncbi:MAG: asparagine synthase-related protein [bacterium]
MLITATDPLVPDARMEHVVTGEWEALWIGSVWYSGFRLGSTSITKFLAGLTAKNLVGRSPALRGAYWLILREIASGQRFALIDPNGLYKAYVSERLLSNNYLDHAAALQLRATDLDPDAVMELLHFGQLFTGVTMTSAIRRLRADELVRFDATGRVQSSPRPVRTMEADPSVTFDGFWTALTGALGSERLSIDLTGGKDSRLIACLCQHAGLDFELALSGHPGHTDVIIGGEVAAALGHTLVVTDPQLGDVHEALPRLFRLADGMHDILPFHRLEQYWTDRASRGITVSLNGAGGEIFNDHWWFHDYPFYSRKVSNLTLLYDTRAEQMREYPHDYFAGDARGRSEAFRSRMLVFIDRYRRERNTESYDLFSMEFKTREMGGRMASSSANNFVNVIMPYLDREVQSVGYHLPRRQRAFNRFHRHEITRLNPAVARVRTSEDMSLSAKPLDMAADSVINVWNKARRLTRKLNQRLLNKRDFPKNPDHPQLRESVRALPLTGELLTALKDHQLINPELALARIPDAHLGWFVTLGLLVRELG